MASIENNRNTQKKFKQKSINKPVKVDLTPMVDLGFLLITFFIFTTTIGRATAMNMHLPDDRDSSVNDAVCKSCALTVIAGANNQLYYYEGADESPTYLSTDYSANGIRQIIQQKKQDVLKLRGVDETKLIIKLAASSSFKNMVDLIDESTIACVKRYYLAELSETDKNFILKNKN